MNTNLILESLREPVSKLVGAMLFETGDVIGALGFIDTPGFTDGAEGFVGSPNIVLESTLTF